MIKNQEIITSRQNKTIVWVSGLSEKKHRDASCAFALDGIKLFSEAVYFDAAITHVFLAESKAKQFLPMVEKSLSGEKYEDTILQIVADSCFEKLTKEKSPQGIVTVAKYLDKIKNNIKIYKDNVFIDDNEKVLLLSSLRDPSNIGAVLRSASAFGTETIIMSADCADVYQPKCVRAAMGALFRTRILICEDMTAAIAALREHGHHIYAAELKPGAKPIDSLTLTASDAFVIGNEGHGISEDISLACDGSVFLPISSNTESLNAAVAASIFLWEMRNC